jgi:MoaA/NifB/PqqE/SkfB family radical SAM enzyme
MELNGLHLILTYQCTFECDHCFVWGSPWQSGTMTIETVRKILHQAKQAETIKWIFFEGGEPFLYYQVMLAGINDAVDLGFKVGVVSNSYWATSEEDALLWLSPFVNKVQDLTISSDLFHYTEKMSLQAKNASKIAQQLGIPIGIICVEQPGGEGISTLGQIPQDEASVMYRGRAAEKLISKANLSSMAQFYECPHEDLRNPGRVHIDPFGNLHICQGISIGNIFNSSIKDICEKYNPDAHSIITPLLTGGPVELVNRYRLPFSDTYADACHMCYEARKQIRERYPDILKPDQMYGVVS